MDLLRKCIHISYVEQLNICMEMIFFPVDVHSGSRKSNILSEGATGKYTAWIKNTRSSCVQPSGVSVSRQSVVI